MLRSKDKIFFDTFTALSDKIHSAAVLLHEMMRRYDRPQESAARIKALEHECDAMTHKLVKALNATFITPFDREDIHDLATRLDDVIDFIDNTADRMISYRIASPPPEMERMADVLVRQTSILRDAVGNLRKTDHILEKCLEIHRLENEGDRIFHEGIGRMFSGKNTDPIEIIKEKDILQTVEQATDKCEDAANVLEAIMLKNA
jgi:predicted phosphate transport protein (TIGR00153 family)